MLNEAFAECQNQKEVNVPQPCRGIRLGARVKLVQIPHEIGFIIEVVKLPAAKLDNVDEVECVVEGGDGGDFWILWSAQAIPTKVIGRSIKEQGSCW
jgi:hypothetical protein